MAVTRWSVGLVLLSLFVSLGHGQTPHSPAAGGPTSEVATQAAAPSSPISAEVVGGVTGVDAPGASLLIPVSGYISHSVVLHSVSDTGKNLAVLNGVPSSAGLTITLPADLDPGSYYFTLGDKDIVVPGSIMIAPERIKLISIHPSVAYRSKSDDFNFDMVGENFSTNPRNDDVTIAGRGSVVRNYGASESDCQGKEGCLWVENERLMHIVGYHAERYQGIVKIGVRVGNVAAADEKPLILARYSGPVVVLMSAAATGILFWFVYYIVAKGLAKNKVGNKRLQLLQTFIFDPQTNSYSLSKFQLMMFSATFIFGYVYVLLSRLLVQWQFSLPDVPATIAGLLGVSGGTVIAAVGLTSAHGSKGAGLQTPTGADLISTGGVVVPERFQFFVWTIIACGGFTALLIGQDPGRLSNFPDLPTGLLYVMGVSAAGYLGGKATRKPGPIVEYVATRKPTSGSPWTKLIVQGQNLASDGRLFIDGTELGYPSDADKAKCDSLPAKLVIPTPQTGNTDPTFSKQLEITIVNSAIDVCQGDHTFRIVNLDGQFATVTFTANPPAIASVYEKGKGVANGSKTLRATDQAITAIIAGSGLDADSQVAWKAPGDNLSTALALTSGGPGDGKELWVSMVPGQKTGTPGTLTVITATGVVVNASVQIAQAPDAAASVPLPAQQPAAPAPAGDQSAPAPAVGAKGDVPPGAMAAAKGPDPNGP